MPDAPDNTRMLLDEWHRGDRKSLERLLERDLPWIRQRVHRRLGDALRAKVETQDVVQDAVIDVLLYGPRFVMSDRGQFRALLARIVENTLRDQYKWAQARRRAGEREVARAARSAVDLDPVASVTQPHQALERDERRQWVRLAMELLGPEDRRILQLRQWESLSFEAIAERTGLQANTARMRFQRALGRLADRMRELRGGLTEDGDGS